MSYASKAGRARTSSRSPESFAVCDRCAIWTNRNRLRFQYEWRGAALQNTYFLVCDRCYDTPQENIRAIQLPADPLPVIMPRTEPYLADETDYRVTTAPALIDPTTGIPIPQGDKLVTLAGDERTTQPLGAPNGIAQAAIQPQFKAEHFGPTISVLSLNSDGFYTVTVTCSAPHGLATNAPISVQGTTFNGADGTYSVTVTTAMAFTYTTQNVTPQGNLLAGGTRIWTLRLGLPLGYEEVPQT